MARSYANLVQVLSGCTAGELGEIGGQPMGCFVKRLGRWYPKMSVSLS